MTKIPACSWNSHPAPPLLRLRVLLLWSIDSLHFYSRNPSVAYQQLTFPRTPPFLHPTILDSWPRIPAVTPVSKKIMCLSGCEFPILIRLGSAFTDKAVWLHYPIFKQYRKTCCLIINCSLLYERWTWWIECLITLITLIRVVSDLILMNIERRDRILLCGISTGAQNRQTVWLNGSLLSLFFTANANMDSSSKNKYNYMHKYL